MKLDLSDYNFELPITKNMIFLFTLDLTLKVWRVYPFASEALAPLFMFMSSLPATHLIFAHFSLGVVYQDSAKSSYILSMFKTDNPKSGT